MELLQFGLLVGGWVVSFLLGRELQVGFVQWRKRVAAKQDRPGQ